MKSLLAARESLENICHRQQTNSTKSAILSTDLPHWLIVWMGLEHQLVW